MDELYITYCVLSCGYHMDMMFDTILITILVGGRRSPAVACWASDHWVASSNPLRGKFRH